MPAPTWDQYMAPSLRVLLDGEVRGTRQIVEGAADLLDLTPEQREILIPSGQQQWVNRGNWGLSYLSRAGATERPSRGHYRITESRLYVQAKRYGPDNTVGREAIRAFVGALAGHQAHQGVFITTSRFAQTAVNYAASVATRVILIDGERLTRLMIRYGVGVQVKQTIQIVEIDEDFFE